MKNLFFSVTLVVVLSLPIFGFIYLGHFIGTVAGITFSVLLLGAWNKSRKAVKAGLTKELLRELACEISIGNFSVTIIALIFGGIFYALTNNYCGGAHSLWFLVPFYYYCWCLPVGISFGLIFFSGIKDFQENLEKRRIIKWWENNSADDWALRNEKFLLRYLNPITLPLSLAYFPFWFLYKFIQIIVKSIKLYNSI